MHMVGIPRQRTTAIQVEDLVVRIGRRNVVDGISLRVEPGEVVAVLGRPGAGRSVLLRSIAGLEYRAAGRVEVLEGAAHLPRTERLAPWSTVAAAVRRVQRVGEDGVRRLDVDQAGTALHLVGLDGQERHRVGRLSPGERRRLEIARAVAAAPPALLLDQPCNGLDTVSAAQVRAALQGVLARHRPAVLCATDDVDEALLLADRVVVVERGRVVLDRVVDLGPRRRRGDAGFARQRSLLLAALHVDELAEGARS